MVDLKNSKASRVKVNLKYISKNNKLLRKITYCENFKRWMGRLDCMGVRKNTLNSGLLSSIYLESLIC